jgi:hypothetical protein
LTYVRHWRTVIAVIFIESPVFTHQVQELLTDEQYAEFQQYLALTPNAGPVIEATGGLRKIRWTVAGRGKRRCASDLLSRLSTSSGPNVADLSQGCERRSECRGEEDSPQA